MSDHNASFIEGIGAIASKHPQIFNPQTQSSLHMPKITFIAHDGAEKTVEAEVGGSVMEAAIDHDVDGIDADCGGCCSCATCHVYVAPEWRGKTGEPQDMEEDMLSINDDRQEGSRLSCQIEVTEELDGLVVRVPEFQM